MFPFAFWKTPFEVNTAYMNYPASRLLSVPHYSDVDFEHTDAMAVSFWVKHDSSALTRYVIAKYAGATASGRGWAIATDTQAIRRPFIRWSDGAGGVAQFISSLGIGISTWSHVLYIFAGGDVNTTANHIFYINGVRSNTLANVVTYNTGLTAKNTDAIRVGGVGTSAWIGGIDEVMVFNANIHNDYTPSQALFGVGLAQRTPEGLDRWIGRNNLKLYLKMGDRFTEGGGVLTIPNEASAANPGTSTNLTSADITTPAGIKWTEYVSAERVEWKNLSVYAIHTDNWSQNVAKTTNDGVYVGSAQSTRKMVGSGMVSFWIHSAGNLRHTYMGITDSAVPLSSNPAVAGNRYVFGAANGATTVYFNGAVLFSGSIPNTFDLFTIEQSGNDFLFKVNSVTVYTAVNGALNFPNGWYVTPNMLYVQNLHRVCWEMWFKTTGGTLQTNDLI